METFYHYEMIDEDWIFCIIKSDMTKPLFRLALRKYRNANPDTYNIDWFVEEIIKSNHTAEIIFTIKVKF